MFLVSGQLWKTIASNTLLHNSKSISNFYYFPQSNSLYFSAFRSVSFLCGFRGGFQCNDISIQFRPFPPLQPLLFTAVPLHTYTWDCGPIDIRSTFYFFNVILFYASQSVFRLLQVYRNFAPNNRRLSFRFVIFTCSVDAVILTF